MTKLTIEFDYLDIGWEIEKDAARENGVIYDRIPIAIVEGGEAWGDDFWLYIKSRAWLSSKIKNWNDTSIVESTLIVDRYDRKTAQRYVEDILKNSNGLSTKETFNYLTYFLEHETQDWLYRPRKGFSVPQVSDGSGKLVVEKIMFPNTERWNLSQYENCNLRIGFIVNDKAVNKEYLFYVDVISTQWIEKALNRNPRGLYLKKAYVMKFYDQSLVEGFIRESIKIANHQGEAKAFDCLTHQVEYENESLLYEDVKELSL